MERGVEVATRRMEAGCQKRNGKGMDGMILIDEGPKFVVGEKAHSPREDKNKRRNQISS